MHYLPTIKLIVVAWHFAWYDLKEMIFNEAKLKQKKTIILQISIFHPLSLTLENDFLSLGIRNFSGPIKATHDNKKSKNNNNSHIFKWNILSLCNICKEINNNNFKQWNWREIKFYQD